MQIDLFPSPQEVREKCGNVRDLSRTSSPAPYQKGKCGNPHFPFPQVRESAGTSLSGGKRRLARESAEPPEKDAASQIRDALAERLLLEEGLVDALDAEEAAEEAMRPFQSAFAVAHRRLEEAHGNPESTKAERLSLAMARMWAGHARHPYKRRHEELQGWRVRIEKELRNVNATLERLGKARIRAGGG